MVKKILKRNGALYLLAAMNIIYAVTHEWNWLSTLAAVLSAVVLALDIYTEVKHGNKTN